VVAVTEAGEAAPIALQRGNQDGFEANEGLLWCSCDAERVTISLAAAGKSRVGLRWRTAPMPDVGGIEVLGATPVAGFTVISDGADLTCADPAFGAWASVGDRGNVAELTPERAGVAAQLRAEGLEAAGVFAVDRRFGVVRAAADTCYLAVPEASGATLTLRSAKGEPLVSKTSNAIGWSGGLGKSLAHPLAT